MKIRIWGCRGSLPTPGRSTARYGGNTTCLEIVPKEGPLIIIDAGSGLRKLGKRVAAEKKEKDIYLIMTHPHWDHLMGFPFFVPAYLPDYKIHVRGGPRAKRYLKRYLSHQMDAPYFPVPYAALRAEFDYTDGDPKKRDIGAVTVTPIRTSHPQGCYGYKFSEAGKHFVFLTDHELGFDHGSGVTEEEYMEFCRGAELLIHDAQYTDEQYKLTRGWGHSTFAAVTDFAVRAEVKRLGLFHHDPDHSDQAMDTYETECREQIELVNGAVECFGVREGTELSI